MLRPGIGQSGLDLQSKSPVRPPNRPQGLVKVTAFGPDHKLFVGLVFAGICA